MKYLSKFEPWIFFTATAILLIPIWSVDFFVTGDGPCHLHNSKIIIDFWDAAKKAFYDPFYFRNPNFDPNWLFNLITILLLKTVGPVLAERTFFSIYVLGFAFGFRYLIRGFNPHSQYLATVGLLFCFHKLLMSGFLNNALSFVIWFWIVGWWWRRRSDFRLHILIITSLLMLLLYSSHPVGTVFTLFMISCLLTGLFLYDKFILKSTVSRNLLLNRTGALFLACLPMIVLFLEYLSRHNMSADTKVHHVKEAMINLAKLASLISLDSSEVVFSILTSVLCFLILATCTFFRIRDKNWASTDGLLVFLILSLILIIYPPGFIFGGLELAFRFGIVPFLALLCWAATATTPPLFQTITQIAALVICIGFVTVRTPLHSEASRYATEINETSPHIKDESTLFVLNYDWQGQTPEGEPITDRMWLFSHVDCYLGVDKSLIISDNYEAHFWYFPIISRWNTDMYAQTDKDGINFDHRPPRADILSYNRRTQQNLDYVLLLSYREEFSEHPYTKEIFEQLSQYDLVYTSTNKRAILYKRRGF